MTDEKVKPNEEQKRRVFQALDLNGPSQLTVLQQKGSELHGTDPLTIVLDRNKAAQFVLENNVEPYVQVLRNLRRAAAKYNIVEIGVGKDGKKFVEGILPDALKATSPEDELKEAKLRDAENSEVITNLKAVAAKQNEDMEEMQKTIEELKAKLGQKGGQ